jgi:hypothetical protein
MTQESFGNQLIPELSGLKARLLSSELNPSDFLHAIFELDQSDDLRTNALTNIQLLEQPDTVTLFEQSESKEEFYNIRSLTYFHIGQIHAYNEEGDILKDFKLALSDAERSGQDNQEWLWYVQATVAYLENDLTLLKELFEKLNPENNKTIVFNFIHGLETRGYPSYMEDMMAARIDHT